MDYKLIKSLTMSELEKFLILAEGKSPELEAEIKLEIKCRKNRSVMIPVLWGHASDLIAPVMKNLLMDLEKYNVSFEMDRGYSYGPNGAEVPDNHYYFMIKLNKNRPKKEAKE